MNTREKQSLALLWLGWLAAVLCTVAGFNWLFAALGLTAAALAAERLEHRSRLFALTALACIVGTLLLILRTIVAWRLLGGVLLWLYVAIPILAALGWYTGRRRS